MNKQSLFAAFSAYVAGAATLVETLRKVRHHLKVPVLLLREIEQECEFYRGVL